MGLTHPISLDEFVERVGQYFETPIVRALVPQQVMPKPYTSFSFVTTENNLIIVVSDALSETEIGGAITHHLAHLMKGDSKSKKQLDEQTVKTVLIKNEAFSPEIADNLVCVRTDFKRLEPQTDTATISTDTIKQAGYSEAKTTQAVLLEQERSMLEAAIARADAMLAEAKAAAVGPQANDARGVPPGCIEVGDITEANMYVCNHLCEKCGGSWVLRTRFQRDLPDVPERYVFDQYEIECQRCGNEASIVFAMDTDGPAYQAQMRMLYNLIQ